MQLGPFLKYNLPLLAFGLLLTFFSSFGQTFLLSLYVPSIEALLDVSNTGFGTMYAIATLGSAFTLPWIGGYFDKMEVRRYTLMVVAGLTAALLLLSFSYHIVMVVMAFYGLRLFGQGLMSHTAVSSMARYFSDHRGKAIGVATMGHPGGEALLPLIIAVLIGVLGWRSTLQVSALSCIVLVAPLAMLLLNRSKTRIHAYKRTQRKRQHSTTQFSVGKMIREKAFWIIAPVVFVLGFTNTAIFFFQLKLGEARGWNPEWVAGSLSAFAIASAMGMLSGGPLVDRFSGRRLFPFFMAPYVIGLIVLISFEHRLVYPTALLFMGLSNGAGSTIKNAMLAEIYGTDVIGRVRSIFTTVMVFSTAIGPITFGILLDHSWSFSLIFTAVAVLMGATVVNGFRKMKR